MRNLKFFGGFLLVAWLLVACSEEGQEKIQPEENEEQVVENEEETINEEEPENDEETSDENETDEEESEEKKHNEESDEVKDVEENIEPQYYLNDVWYFKPIDDADPNVVLITIDDAPDKYALEMAKTLKEYDAPAIFFVNGHFMDTEEEQEIVKEIYDMGFHIGNHTYNHKNLREVSEEQQKEEILSLNNLIEEVTGEKPKFFRAPHGANTDYAKELVKNEDMLLMNWSYGYDFQPEYTEKDALTEVMLNEPLLGKGANLLMHDREWTNAALPGILEGLQEKGYGFLDPDLIQIDDE
ncbi:polysaccharide deacetylase family protein [Piscibacillus sp. B03]|uniref:polysaccharide deacetylase family protein n=1 Tax=Piscibacillus sp. B03 TaxID=3457430 RepID=UPI003FCC5F3F